MARLSLRRPWPVLVIVVIGLAVLAAPARHASFSQVDDRALPAANPAEQASATLRAQFPGQAASPVDVVVPGGADQPAALAAYAAELSRVDGVTQVVTPTAVVVDGEVVRTTPTQPGWTSGSDARLQLVSPVAPRTPAGQALVGDVRAVSAPLPGVLVGGVAADYTDAQAAIVHRLPLALG